MGKRFSIERQVSLFEADDKAAKMPLAVVSEDGLYRYFLSRTWDEHGKVVAFIGLNPSTADARSDDPTIRRCIRFAKDWGGGALWMVNLFAYRATSPRMLQTVADPFGPANEEWLIKAVNSADLTIAAWGNHGSLFNQSSEIKRRFLGKLHALSVTQQGMPGHPLYLPAESTPAPYC